MASNEVQARIDAQTALENAEKNGITTGPVHAQLKATFDAALAAEKTATNGTTGWGILG